RIAVVGLVHVPDQGKTDGTRHGARSRVRNGRRSVGSGPGGRGRRGGWSRGRRNGDSLGRGGGTRSRWLFRRRQIREQLLQRAGRLAAIPVGISGQAVQDVDGLGPPVQV